MAAVTCMKGRIKTGCYFDSVTLMLAGKELRNVKGVVDAAVVMGTAENKKILAAVGLIDRSLERAKENEIIIVVKVNDASGSESVAESLLSKAEEILARASKKSEKGELSRSASSLDGAIKILSDANLVVISIAGRFAAAEARRALERGLHVMLFSDNVSLESEIELKTFALDQGLLFMGPDCGTAIINGVPLGFANAVPRGDIGIVAASGTGLQEVSSIIANRGGGISQAIGTGGRDVKKEVGGVMFLEALRALKSDNATRVIVLVSKPPDKSVLERITREVAGAGKPVVAIFLGEHGQGKKKSPSSMHLCATLEEAALVALALQSGKPTNDVQSYLAAQQRELKDRAACASKKCRPEQKYLRGLFSGGTFCIEAQVILGESLSSVKNLKDSLNSEGHTVIDLGEDEFTVGRPHPMIDYSLRNQRIYAEAGDSEVAVILLDVILGYGAHPDPVTEIGPVIREVSKKVCVVCSVTGTDRDPQNRKGVASGLVDAGALVAPSNAAACSLAGLIIKQLPARRAQKGG
jgi:FdrA protein